MSASDPMPVTPMGFDGQVFRIRDATGREVAMTANALFNLKALSDLFGGEGWLRRNFPHKRYIVPQRAGGAQVIWLGIDVPAVAWHLADACHDAEEARLEAQRALIRPWWSKLLVWRSARRAGARP